jgi:hypothetical protein
VPAITAPADRCPLPPPQLARKACPPSSGCKAPATELRCSLPGCSALAQRVGGGPAEFCCADHASRAQARGLLGRSAALVPQVERVWPTAAGDSGAVGRACGTVALMTREHTKYAVIRQQFLEAWRHPLSVKARPVVQRIYQASRPSANTAARPEPNPDSLSHPRLSEPTSLRSVPNPPMSLLYLPNPCSHSPSRLPALAPPLCSESPVHPQPACSLPLLLASLDTLLHVSNLLPPPTRW